LWIRKNWKLSNTSLTVGAFEPLREPGGTLNQSTKEAREIRNKFKDYFNGIGATDTQDEIIAMRDENIFDD
jgi:hypothetical protein